MSYSQEVKSEKVAPVIVTTADDFCQVRKGPLRMRFPADADTTERLNNVINSEPVKWVIDGKERLGWFRKVIRWLRK